MLFAIRIFDKAEKKGARDSSRQAHLEYNRQFDPNIYFSGPLLTDDLTLELGSLRLIDLPDREAADRYVAEDPYVIEGVQHNPAIYRWSNSVPYTWRDCPRTKGHVQYVISAIDNPNSDELRNQIRQEHEDYQAKVSDLYITRGPLLVDDGNRQIGSLMIIDVPGLAEAKKFWEEEPFNYGGLFAKSEFHGWRFGRIFDRFK